MPVERKQSSGPRLRSFVAGFGHAGVENASLKWVTGRGHMTTIWDESQMLRLSILKSTAPQVPCVRACMLAVPRVNSNARVVGMEVDSVNTLQPAVRFSATRALTG